MDRVVARRPQLAEREELHRMKRQLGNAVNSRHARMFLLSTGGVGNREIAQRVDCTAAWVRRIIHYFNQGGIDAIVWYPWFCRPFGPRKFMADVVEQIAEVAMSPPAELIGMSVWSLAKLRACLVAKKILPSISLEWLRQLLRRRRIRWRHTPGTRHTLLTGKITHGTILPGES